MNKLINCTLTLTIFTVIVPILSSCDNKTLPVEEMSINDDEVTVGVTEIGQHIYYSPQSIYGDFFITGEYVFGNSLEKQYIILFNLRTGEKEIIKEIPLDHRFESPSIWKNQIVWSECVLPPGFLDSLQKDFDTLDWNIYFLDLDTGEERQITADESAQYSARISDDYIVWLDARHEIDKDYPHYYDVYAYDLLTGKEIRVTTNTTVNSQDLGISGNIVVWTDFRNDDPEIRIRKEKPPIFNTDIYCYDLSAGTEIQVTDDPANDSLPSIDNGIIVWQRQFGTINEDVYLYEMENGRERQISSSGYASGQIPPGIFENLIIWGDSRLTEGQSSGDCFGVDMERGTAQSGSSEIFMYNLDLEEEILLIASKGTEFAQNIRDKEIISTAWQVLNNPVIHGNYVIYTDAIQVGSKVYVKKLGEN